MHPRMVWTPPDEPQTEHEFDLLQEQKDVREHHQPDAMDPIVALVLVVAIAVLLAAAW